MAVIILRVENALFHKNRKIYKHRNNFHRINCSLHSLSRTFTILQCFFFPVLFSLRIIFYVIFIWKKYGDPVSVVFMYRYNNIMSDKEFPANDCVWKFQRLYRHRILYVCMYGNRICMYVHNICVYHFSICLWIFKAPLVGFTILLYL